MPDYVTMIKERGASACQSQHGSISKALARGVTKRRKQQVDEVADRESTKVGILLSMYMIEREMYYAYC
jgi:hypothetical protein